MHKKPKSHGEFEGDEMHSENFNEANLIST